MPAKKKPTYKPKAQAKRTYKPRAYKGKGKYTLANAGAQIGGVAGSMLSKILGQGEYQVSKNSIMKPDSIPYMHKSDSSIVVTHKEFIKDITATNAFSIEKLVINPGMSATFPWLSTIAQSFQQYQLLGCVVYFKSESADALNSTNTALGTIVMASDYNALDSPFETKAGMTATTFSSSGRPSSDQIHPIECDPAQSSGPALRYVRSASVTTGDLRLYDWCNSYIASQGVQATSVVGSLHIAYSVLLRNPELTVPRGLNLRYSRLFQGTAITNSNPLGTSAISKPFDSIGVTNSHDTLFMEANRYGKYQFCTRWLGSNTASLAGTVALSNCTAINLFDDGTTFIVSNATTTATVFYQDFAVEVIDGTLPWTVQFVSNVLPTTCSGCDITICKINGNI